MPFLRRGVSELHSVRMSVKGEHPIKVALFERVRDHGVMMKVDAHDIVTHAVRIASVHEQLDSVVKKRKKKGGRVMHAVTLEEEGLIDLHITAWYPKSAIYIPIRGTTHFQRCVWRARPERPLLRPCSTIGQCTTSAYSKGIRPFHGLTRQGIVRDVV